LKIKSKETTLKVCLAIPTYNRERVLVETLKSVFGLKPKPNEILVIDQTEEHEPETTRFLQSAHKKGWLRWIKHNPPNLPGARNRALKETNCDILVFIDDDVLLPKSFVENHLKNYEGSDVKAVAGRVTQEMFNYPSVPQKWPRIKDYYYLSLDSNKRVENISTFRGCNFSIRVDYMKFIGGFDENYIGWAYREDSDASIRIWKSGGNIVFDPKSSLIHLAAPSGGCRINRNIQRPVEWTVSFPANYFAFRHFFPNVEFWKQILILNVRRYVLRKDNLYKIWRFPMAIFAYVYSLLLAFKIHLELRNKSHD
jgi:GT2 family glycosyltransferase